jgi:hypothetical protein
VRYLWDESSGKRKYTKAEHESFFALLDQLGNVTAAVSARVLWRLYVVTISVEGS